MPKMASMNITRPTHLYIVEDSQAVRGRLVDLLSRVEGVRIVGEAADASTAVTGILALRPDSVVLDLHLGASNGMQVLRAIHPHLPQTVFVVLTNHSEPQYRRACANAGAAHFLDKSTEFERVREVIASIAATRH
jgi:DNA-binding NarL/FixJ family response regulator